MKAQRKWTAKEEKYLDENWNTPLEVQARELRRTVKEISYHRGAKLGYAAHRLIDECKEYRSPPKAVTLGHLFSVAIAHGKVMSERSRRNRKPKR